MAAKGSWLAGGEEHQRRVEGRERPLLVWDEERQMFDVDERDLLGEGESCHLIPDSEAPSTMIDEAVGPLMAHRGSDPEALTGMADEAEESLQVSLVVEAYP